MRCHIKPVLLHFGHMAQYNKLVRDGIPEMLDQKGISYEKRILDDEEYREQLIKKLDEEVHEFLAEPSTEELADVMEVVRALRRLPEFENAKLVQRAKRDERGGFDERIMLKGEK